MDFFCEFVDLSDNLTIPKLCTTIAINLKVSYLQNVAPLVLKIVLTNVFSLITLPELFILISRDLFFVSCDFKIVKCMAYCEKLSQNLIISQNLQNSRFYGSRKRKI